MLYLLLPFLRFSIILRVGISMPTVQIPILNDELKIGYSIVKIEQFLFYKE